MDDDAVRTVGVVGASGFAGAEVLRLVHDHPDLDVRVATGDSHAGIAVADLYPHLAAGYPELTLVTHDPHALDGLDVVVLALPHGVSGGLAGDLVDRVGVVIDLAADFRLNDAALYDEWYGAPHPAPELLDRFVYGLPELFADDLDGATCVAMAGCYPTAAALAIAPMVRSGLVEPGGVIVDAVSGVSGAGRKLDHATSFTTADGNVAAYGLPRHRHTPEIEQATGATVVFTPHLVPMARGILATCYLSAVGETSTGEVLDVLARAYADAPFVVVSERLPSTKATTGSNTCHLGARHDERTGTTVVIAAIDNLVKGTSGQAIQVLNRLAGRDETTGLTVCGVSP